VRRRLRRRRAEKRRIARRRVRLYRMTIATFHYDKPTHQLVEYEMHFKIARRGDIRRIRLRLAKLGAAYFQRWLRRTRKISVPRRKLKIAFEREAHAKVQEDMVIIRRFVMQRVKTRWRAQELPRGIMSYVKRRKRLVKRRR